MLRYLEANKLDSIDNVNKVSALFKVKEEYLDRLFAAIYAEYGKVERFFAQGIVPESKDRFRYAEQISDLKNCRSLFGTV